MKRFICIVSILVYWLSASSFVHASMMGFLDNTQSIHDCHHINSTQPHHNMSCCELVYSNHYTHCQLKVTDPIQLFSLITPLDVYALITQLRSDNIPLLYGTPRRDPGIKNQKFSDLVGIIVNTI